jgi:hypothetical protein
MGMADEYRKQWKSISKTAMATLSQPGVPAVSIIPILRTQFACTGGFCRSSELVLTEMTSHDRDHGLETDW